MSDTSVTSLISGLKHRDHAAVEQLWIRYFEKLVAIARRNTSSARGRSWDEEDVALSAFDALCRGVERGCFTRLSNREDLWALLLTLTRQRIVDRERYDGRQKRGGGQVRGESAFANADESGAPGIEQLVADDPTPDSLVIFEEQYSRLVAVLPDEKLRQIVALRLEGHTVRESLRLSATRRAGPSAS